MRNAMLLVALILLSPAATAAQEISGRAGVLGLATRRAASFEGQTGTSNATMSGVELSIRRGLLGLSARGTSAQFLSDTAAIAAGRVTYGDLRARFGPEIIAANVGWGRRALAGSLGRRDWSFIRLGAESEVPIGGSGLTASMALGWYPSVSGSGDFQSGRGADAETRIAYDFIDFPAYVAIGYRVERFTSESPDDIRPDELSSMFASVGFRLHPGTFGTTERDEDQDGVRDRDDACLVTTLAGAVDAMGCRLDGDGDGVFDEADRCPSTPMGVRVDRAGCRLDEDSDGVHDEDDACPGTPSDAPVDAVGCRLDPDRDGVYEPHDACPATPAGVMVDATGCRMDTDGDNVFDDDDACPNTPPGTEVDLRGCPILFEAGETSLVLEGVTFETNSADLTANAMTILNLVAEALLANAEVRVRVIGHTDSSGSRDYNVSLSQDRAESVKRYLETRGVDESRMESLGVGPDQPIADNATPDGRQINRRVELVRIDGGAE